MKFSEQLKSGVILDNPVFMQTIGLCPTLATTTSLQNAIGMGAAATVVLICSNIVISAMRRIIPDKIRIAAFITIIATFVTMIDLSMQAFLPSLASSLGLFLPLIVVNCIILGRAEAYASKNKVLPSALDGVVMGLGFTFALVLMGFFRELLGAGTILSGYVNGVNGIAVPFFHSNPMVMMILPAGGFLMMGFILAAIQKIMARKEDKQVFNLPASMGLTDILSLAIAAILVNNYILVQFLGCCSFFGVSKKTDTALGMGMAVIFVMAIASAASWAVQYFILEPLGLGYMQTIAFILVIATLVQFVEMFMKKAMPSLYSALGIFLPLITTNCAVLGAAKTNISNSYSFIGSLVYGVAAGVGYTLAIVLFASIRERLDATSKCPKCFEGFPISLVAAALLAMSFMGFSGLSIW